MHGSFSAANPNTLLPAQCSLPDLPAIPPHLSLRKCGDCTFAEDPDRPFADARIIWSAPMDPSVLQVRARRPRAGENELDLAAIACKIHCVRAGAIEHVACKLGSALIRLDVIEGSVFAGPVHLEALVPLSRQLPWRIGAMRELAKGWDLARSVSGQAPDKVNAARLVEALRVLDALNSGASLHAIARTLYGIDVSWPGNGECTKSRTRRIVAKARQLKETRPSDILSARGLGSCFRKPNGEGFQP